MSRPRPGSLASRLVGTTGGAVLVVEDEPDIASFLSAFFRASGTDVVSLDPADPSEVVERAAALNVSCLLVDLNLGGFTGFDVLEAIASDDRVRDIPVLVVTADSRSSTQERAVALGAAGFVPKPFNVKDLFVTVQALVEGSHPQPSQDGNGIPMISADALNERLAAAVRAAQRDRVPATFALVRVTGAAPSPALVNEVARAIEPGVPAEILGATAADELALLFPDAGDDAARAALDALVAAGPLEVEPTPGRSVHVGLQIGLASTPEHAVTADELYMAADTALAEAVDGGEAVVTAR